MHWLVEICRSSNKPRNACSLDSITVAGPRLFYDMVVDGARPRVVGLGHTSAIDCAALVTATQAGNNLFGEPTW